MANHAQNITGVVLAVLEICSSEHLSADRGMKSLKPPGRGPTAPDNMNPNSQKEDSHVVPGSGETSP